VIGVLPPDVEPSEPERIYVSLERWADNESARSRGNHMDTIAVARLKPGVRFEEARVEMEALAKRLEETYPKTNTGVGANVRRFEEFRTRDYRATLWMLLGAVGFVLLIACTNVANLLLARAATRQKETAIRAALGAGSLRLLRQALTESVLLALIGGGLGLALAFSSLGLMRNLIEVRLPGIEQLQLNWAVLGYSVGVSVLTGLIFGLAPAVLNSRLDLNRYLKEGGKTSGSALGRRSLGRGLLVAEVALATVLLIGAGLLIRTVFELNQASPGFQTANLLTMQMQLPGSYDTDKRIVFYRQLRERIEALPGVESASAGLSIPMLGSNWTSIFVVADQPVPPRSELPSSAFNPVGVGYFEAVRIPLVRGRVFDETDTAESEPVIVINQSLARTMWPGQDPLGKRPLSPWRWRRSGSTV
jgi:putative ABC transport system permease protein